MYPNRLIAWVTGALDLLQNLIEVPGLRRLHRRKLLVRLEFLQPQQLTDGQHVPVIEEGGDGTGERAAHPVDRLLTHADRLLEWIALDVLNQGEVERDERQNPPLRPGLRHIVIHLPVLVANRGGR